MSAAGDVSKREAEFWMARTMVLSGNPPFTIATTCALVIPDSADWLGDSEPTAWDAKRTRMRNEAAICGLLYTLPCTVQRRLPPKQLARQGAKW
jgi:hypothetical protein